VAQDRRFIHEFFWRMPTWDEVPEGSDYVPYDPAWLEIQVPQMSTAETVLSTHTDQSKNALQYFTDFNGRPYLMASESAGLNYSDPIAYEVDYNQFCMLSQYYYYYDAASTYHPRILARKALTQAMTVAAGVIISGYMNWNFKNKILQGTWEILKTAPSAILDEMVTEVIISSTAKFLGISEPIAEQLGETLSEGNVLDRMNNLFNSPMTSYTLNQDQINERLTSGFVNPVRAIGYLSQNTDFTLIEKIRMARVSAKAYAKSNKFLDSIHASQATRDLYEQHALSHYDNLMENLHRSEVLLTARYPDFKVALGGPEGAVSTTTKHAWEHPDLFMHQVLENQAYLDKVGCEVGSNKYVRFLGTIKGQGRLSVHRDASGAWHYVMMLDSGKSYEIGMLTVRQISMMVDSASFIDPTLPNGFQTALDLNENGLDESIEYDVLFRDNWLQYEESFSHSRLDAFDEYDDPYDPVTLLKRFGAISPYIGGDGSALKYLIERIGRPKKIDNLKYIPYSPRSEELIKDQQQIIAQLISDGKMSIGENYFILDTKALYNWPAEGIPGSSTYAEFMKGDQILDIQNWPYLFERTDIDDRHHIKNDVDSDIIQYSEDRMVKVFPKQLGEAVKVESGDFSKKSINSMQNMLNVLARIKEVNIGKWRQMSDEIVAFNNLEDTSMTPYEGLTNFREMAYTVEKYFPGQGTQFLLSCLNQGFLGKQINVESFTVEERAMFGLQGFDYISVKDWLSSSSIEGSYDNWMFMSEEMFSILQNRLSSPTGMNNMGLFTNTNDDFATDFMNNIEFYLTVLGQSRQSRKLASLIATQFIIPQMRPVSTGFTPVTGAEAFINTWAAEFFGLKSIKLFGPSRVRSLADGHSGINFIEYTILNLIHQDFANRFHDGNLAEYNKWNDDIFSIQTDSRDMPSIIPDFFQFVPSSGDYLKINHLNYRLWKSPKTFTYPVRLGGVQSTGRFVEFISKLEIIREDGVSVLISQQNKQEMEYTKSLLYFFTEMQDGKVVIRIRTNPLVDRHVTFGQETVSSIGRRTESIIYYTRTDGSVHKFILDGIHQLMAKDLGVAISLFEILDEFGTGYISNLKTPISQAAFTRGLPMEYILDRINPTSAEYVEVMESHSPMGKLYPLIYRKNGQILNQILNLPATSGRIDPENFNPDHDFTKREVLEQLVPHATQWISNEMLSEAVCEWEYATLEDYQADGHPDATEQDFLNQRKEQLATLIAHNYGVFETSAGSGVWEVQAGEITFQDNDGVIHVKEVDMRLFWFFFENANPASVHYKNVRRSRRFELYQERFLEALDNSGLLDQVNPIALKYITGLSTTRSLQDMFKNDEFIPYMFWFSLASNPPISETDRVT